jgi:hypothetical protein
MEMPKPMATTISDMPTKSKTMRMHFHAEMTSSAARSWPNAKPNWTLPRNKVARRALVT